MFDNILAPLLPDDPTTWERALPTAAGLAKCHDAHLHLLTVVPTFGSNLVAGYFPEGYESEMLERARSELNRVAQEKVSADVAYTTHVAHGWIWQEICSAAGELRADLIVMASHKREFRDVLLAPNADQVLHHAPISVMIVR